MTTKKHVLVLSSWQENEWSDGSHFVMDQAKIMRQLADWKINILAPQVRSYCEFKKYNLKKISEGDEKNSGDIEIWYGYFIYYMWRKTHWAMCTFGEQLFSRYVKKHGMPDFLWVQVIRDAGYLAQHLHKKYGIPYFIHEHLPLHYYKETIPYFERNRIKKIIDNSYYCAAVSKPFQLELLKKIGVAENKISIVYNPVSLEFISPVINRDPNTPFIFISTCYLRHGKNVDSMLRAFAVLRSEKYDVELILVGDGEERQKLESLVAELDLQNAVQFLGKKSREQVKEYLQSADAFVAASEYETFGLTLVESLARGLPAVTTRVGIAEYIINNRNGVLANSTASDDIAEAMRVILNGNYNRVNIHQDAMELCHPQVFVERVKQMLGL